MLERIKKLLSSDEFIPSVQVFPEIDANKIAIDLKLVAQGQARGEKNQPSKDVCVYDFVETSIIERVDALRRQGVENYEVNRRVYNERLARATQVSKEVDIAAGKARNDFGALVQQWRAYMVPAKEKLAEAFKYRQDFRRANRLDRPARVKGNIYNTLALAVMVLLVEAVFNSYLFSKGNEFGLLGGGFVALLVSGVNVFGSIGLGLLARNTNHVSSFRKLAGMIAVGAWGMFAGALNFLVAHFRDGLEAGLPWDHAAIQSSQSFQSSPFDLASVESWLLVAIGVIVSCVSFSKGWNISDPYPGYAAAQRELDEARSAYEEALGNALQALKDSRDSSIFDLQEACTEVKYQTGDAIDALFGQNTLSSHLPSFLEQCNIKVTHLLSVYRDANRSTRTEPAPESFNKDYRFLVSVPEVLDPARRIHAESELERVSQVVDNAIQNIFDQFETARRAFPTTDEVELGVERRADLEYDSVFVPDPIRQVMQSRQRPEGLGQGDTKGEI